jgi:hypothetical protein
MWRCFAEENSLRSLWCNLICESLVEFVQCVWWQGWSMLAGRGGVWCLWLVSDGTYGHSELWQKFRRDTKYVRHVISRPWRCILWSSWVWLSAIWCFNVLPTYLPKHTVARLRNVVWAEVCQWHYLCSVCRYSERRRPVARCKVPMEQSADCRFRIIRIY